MASGIFIVPILTIVTGINVRVAIISIIACSCGSAASFFKQRLTNVRLAIALEVATTLGAASGVLLSSAVPGPRSICDIRRGASCLGLADAYRGEKTPLHRLSENQREAGYVG